MCVPQDIKEMAESGATKVKEVPAHQVAYTVHKGPYDQMGQVFQKLSMWIIEQGYEINRPSRLVVNVNDLKERILVSGKVRLTAEGMFHL